MTIRTDCMDNLEHLNLSENTEDYLEAIYRLCLEKGSVRIKDIAESLGIKNPSVTQQVQKLAGMGLVEHENYGKVSLTDEGKRIGRQVDRRHKLFLDFLEKYLFVPEDIAQEEACRFEHAVSRLTVEHLDVMSDFMADREIYKRYIRFARERGIDVGR